MSSFIVQHSLLDRVLSFAILRKMSVNGVDVTAQNAREFGQLLLNANVAAMNYGQHGALEAPETYQFTMHAYVTAIQVLKHLDCLQYQCDDALPFQGSNADAVIESLRSQAIKSLNGYSEAQWDGPSQLQEPVVQAPVAPAPEAQQSAQDGTHRELAEPVTLDHAALISGAQVVMTPGKSVEIAHSNELYRNGDFARVNFHHVFNVGDTAIYGSFNLVYTGKIVAIGPKTVTIDVGMRNAPQKRLKIEEFVSLNKTFNLQSIQKRNGEWID